MSKPRNFTRGRQCCIDQCSSSVVTRDMCKAHYSRWIKRGSTDRINESVAGASKSPEYLCFLNAKRRCSSPNYKHYANYGGRGIEFRFTSFEEFITAVGKKPSSLHTLDRIDSDGHYEPGNVRWATRSEQSRNLRNNVHLTLNGITKSIYEWSEHTGLKKERIRSRMRKKWCSACCLSTTVKRGMAWTCTHTEVR